MDNIVAYMNDYNIYIPYDTSIYFMVIVSMVFVNIEVVSLSCCILKIRVILLIMVVHMTLFILT